MNIIKKTIQNNKKLSFLISGIRKLQTSSKSKIDGGRKKYPKVLQLPITYHCNSKCVMCNIWKMDYSNEATINEFNNFINDPIFKNIESVGVNGGEPSLIKNLPLYIDSILKLPKLKGIYLISHGFNKKLLLNHLQSIYKKCKVKGVLFSVTISLDGVGKIHNNVRGLNVYEITTSTIDELKANKNLYCDSVNVACTIVKQNINHLIELESLSKLKNYNITYQLGIENKRIDSKIIQKQYSVLYSQMRQSAKEFFHYKMYLSTDFHYKYKYFSIWFWLETKIPKRLLGCAWQEDGITLDSRGNLFYCAVESNKIGSLREERGEDIFFKDDNISYRKEIVKNSCDTCIHGYDGRPEFKNLLVFWKYYFLEKFAMNIYKYWAKIL